MSKNIIDSALLIQNKFGELIAINSDIVFTEDNLSHLQTVVTNELFAIELNSKDDVKTKNRVAKINKHLTQLCEIITNLQILEKNVNILNLNSSTFLDKLPAKKQKDLTNSLSESLDCMKMLARNILDESDKTFFKANSVKQFEILNNVILTTTTYAESPFDSKKIHDLKHASKKLSYFKPSKPLRVLRDCIKKILDIASYVVTLGTKMGIFSAKKLEPTPKEVATSKLKKAIKRF